MLRLHIKCIHFFIGNKKCVFFSLFLAEELQCLAQWKEGSHHYLVGKLTRERTIPTNEESYRCFIYDKTKSGHGGYTVAMSGDATCTGVASSTEGARTLTFSKGLFCFFISLFHKS